MKIKYLLFAIPFLMLAGCKQDINVLNKYKEVPVVYGLLSQQDAVHYIRIQKGYQVQGNAYAAGGITDSIYYPDVLKVQLKVLPNGPTYNMSRVVIPYDPSNPLSKDSGTFAYGTNILYADSHVLDPTLNYLLTITDTTSGKVISAQTAIVNSFLTSTPFYRLGDPLYGTQIALSNSNPQVIDWAPATNGNIYDLDVRFFYTEHNSSTNTSVDSFVDFNLLRSFIPSQSGDIKVDFIANVLFQTLAKQLPVSNEIYRDFNSRKGMQFKFSVGGSALASYLSAGIAQSGLTSDEALPPYTNIPGGVGIFSSRYVEEVDSVQLTPAAIDSLACNSISQPLRFHNHNGELCN